MDESKISFKIIILGDSGVGKSSLALRQCRDQFSSNMASTVGTSHFKTVVKVSDKLVELKIWDTAGQEQFVTLVPMYARGASACIIVGSIVDKDSLANIDIWCQRLHAAEQYPPIIVAINKIDIKDGSAVSIDEIREKYIQKFPNMFFVSAKTGDSVNELFTSAAAEALNAYTESIKNDVVIVQNAKSTQGKKEGCC